MYLRHTYSGKHKKIFLSHRPFAMADTKLIFQILLLYAFITQVCTEVQTYLKEINESDGFTECTEMLLVHDKIVVYGNATFPSHASGHAGGKFIILQGENETVLKQFQYRRFKNCVRIDTNLTFSCTFNETFAMVQLYVNASELLSEHFLQLEVNSSGKSYYSNKVKIPKIVDPSHITMTFNGIIKKHGLLELNRTKENRILEICCNEAPKPCYVEISSSDQVLNTSLHCATYSPKDSDVKLYIGVNVCGVKKSNLYTIKLTNKNTPEASKEDTELILGLSLGIGLVFLIVLAFVVYKIHKNNANHDITDEHEMNDMIKKGIQSIESST